MTESDDRRNSQDQNSEDRGEALAGGEGSDVATGEGADGEEELTLEARLERLEAIVSTLEADDVSLDRALALFEEGVRHVRAAEKALSKAELRVEELLGEGPDLEARPLDAGSE